MPGTNLLLIHFDGSNGSTTVVDSSSHGHPVLCQGDAQLVTDWSAFGPSSGRCTGNTGSYFTLPDSTDWHFVTDNAEWCINLRLRLHATPGSLYTVIGHVSGTGNTGTDVNWALFIDANKHLTFEIGGNYFLCGTALSLDTPYAIAIERKSGVVTLYLNGTSDGSMSSAPSASPGAWTLKIGWGLINYSSYCVDMWIDEVRIIDAAQYAGDYTPEAAAFGSTTASDFSASLHLPHRTATGTALLTPGFVADISLPALTATGVAGLISYGHPFSSNAACQFPSLTIEAAIDIAVGFSGSISLPTLSATGNILKGNLFTGAITFPALTVETIAHAGLSFSGDINLPALISAATLGGPCSFSAAITLPALSSEGSGISALAESFWGIVQNLHTMSITGYDGFNFNSMCKFNGQYLGANGQGISLLDGETDNGLPINADIMPGMTDGNSPFKKKIAYAYLAMSCEKGIRFSLKADDGLGEISEDVVDTDTEMHTVKVKTGRGRESRYWTPRIQNLDGGYIDLDSIELFPEATSRRV